MKSITRNNKSNKQTWREYEALVRGMLWDGEMGCTSYRFDDRPTREDVARRSGDFQHVTAVKIIEHEQSVKPVGEWSNITPPAESV